MTISLEVLGGYLILSLAPKSTLEILVNLGTHFPSAVKGIVKEILS